MSIVNLDKKVADLVNLTKDTGFVNLAKTAAATLKAQGIDGQTARCFLVLDQSGSMGSRFRDGTVEEIIRRALGAAYLLDDNGAIEVVLFNHQAVSYQPDVVVQELDKHVKELSRVQPNGGTSYAAALRMVANAVIESGSREPVLVQFITDGESGDEREDARKLVEISGLPIFVQFVGIGGIDYDPRVQGKQKTGFLSKLFGGSKSTDSGCDFRFLRELDDLQGRVVDNAGFFAVADPSACTDQRYYDLLLTEFPKWLRESYPKVK